MDPGKRGFCGVRENSPALPLYGHVTAMAVDPIEKKPLYHFRPGSRILSLGFAGCNLRCPFCQNWRISQDPGAAGTFVPPEEAVRTALENGGQIAYTYSEPLIHAEYVFDCMKAAGKAGAANVLVTNGCVNPGAARDILALTGAVNVDLKCFSAKSYRDLLGGKLETVLEFISLAAKMKVHTEVTTLVVPGLNDSPGELDACAAFIASVDPSIPWHLSAYHPDYRWTAPPTDPQVITAAARRASEKLPFVYTGNISGGISDTFCPACGAVLIRRRAYRVDTGGLAPGKGVCASCGAAAPVRW
jgi:pyruvate formate lyase activating enzyme